MRPLKLTIAGFGPYAKVQELNFELLGEKGLYLITGDTGAGKTTVFDAISFALFGEASGNNRDASMLRSKYAGAEDPTFVELRFAYKDKVYTVKRNPEYTRPKARGTGTTTQAADAVLTYPDASTVSKLKDVDKAIRDIIGLNREQFSQIAMISQGDFRRLLQADTKERQKIFRDIFGTSHFVTLQNQLKEKASELRDKREQASRSIKQYIEGLMCSEDSELFADAEKARRAELPVAEVIELLEKLISKDGELGAELEIQLAEVEKHLEETTAKLTQAKNYVNLKNQFVQQNEAQLKEESALEQAKLKLSKAKESLPEQEALAKKINEFELLMPSYDERDKKAKEVLQKRADLAACENTCTKAESDKAVLLEEISLLREEHKSLENTAAEKEKLLAECRQVEERRKRFQELIKNFENLTIQRKLLLVKQTAYLSAAEKSEALGHKYEAMNKAFMDEQAGIIASTLSAGKACPVCGSTEHPCLAALSENAPTEQEVKKAKQEYEEAQKQTECANREASTQKGIVSSSEENILKDCSLLLGDAEIEDAESLAITNEKGLKAELDELNVKLKSVDIMLKRRADLDSLIPQKETAIQNAEALLNSSRELAAAMKVAIEAMENQIEELASKLQFKDKAAAENEKLSLHNNLNTLKNILTLAEKEVNEKQTSLAAIRATISQLAKQLEEGEEADVSELEEIKESLTAQKSTIVLKQKQLHTRLSTNQNAQQNISKKTDELENIESRYAWLKSLADTANGNVSGKDKIMLETYVQTTYFERIVQRANIRLRKMSGGQYDLKRREIAGNKVSQSGLELDIVDHVNGSERSVNTLSGGEAFLASLALALGLSDEVQMSTGIHLDTLFVDEGFGSLDGEALNKAYNTLIGLSEGNRLVGIISHVSELKEKIDKQIVVRKNKLGSSSAEII